MAWTYEPVATPRDEVRLAIGDTIPGAAITLVDAEIDYLLVQAERVVWRAAYRAALQLSSRYAQAATSKSVGDLSLSYGDRAKALRDVAQAIRDGQAAMTPPIPWVSPNALKSADQRPDRGHGGTEFYPGPHDNRR